jgi:hypothetical protein
MINFGYVKSKLDVKALFADQERFFREVHGKPLPRLRRLGSEAPTDFFGAIVMANWMTNDRLFHCLRELWQTDWPGGSLDECFARNIRDPKRDGSYIVLCRGWQEVDPQYHEMSPREAQRHGLVSMTLGERLALEIWYRWRHGQGGLDFETSTLCLGSKSVEGKIPRVFSHSVSMRFAIREFTIDGNGSSVMGFREVVPFMPPKPRVKR